ncbi:hypothetical protein ACEPAG_4087 [Sanghuangporus baumii]
MDCLSVDIGQTRRIEQATIVESCSCFVETGLPLFRSDVLCIRSCWKKSRRLLQRRDWMREGSSGAWLQVHGWHTLKMCINVVFVL